MKNQPRAKTSGYQVPRIIQGLFTYPIIGLYLLQSVFITVSTYAQYQNGADYRPQLWYLILYNFLPIAIFIIAYVLNRRQLGLLSKLFESTLITIAAMTLWSVLQMFIPVLTNGNLNPYGSRSYEHLAMISFITAYAITLFVIRRKGWWS